MARDIAPVLRSHPDRRGRSALRVRQQVLAQCKTELADAVHLTHDRQRIDRVVDRIPVVAPRQADRDVRQVEDDPHARGHPQPH